MFKALPIQLVQEDSDDLIQLINPEQDSDLKAGRSSGGVFHSSHKKYRTVSRSCDSDYRRKAKID